MSFWASNLAPGEPTTLVLPEDLHLTNIAIHDCIDAFASTALTLVVEELDDTFIIAHLTPGVCEQAHINIILEKNMVYRLKLEGPNSISIIGSFSSPVSDTEYIGQWA